MFRLTGRSICSKKVAEDSWDLHFAHVVVDGRIINSYRNGFSGKLFTILAYYLEVGDVGSGMALGHAVLLNCTGNNMAFVFFNSVLLTSAGLYYVGKVTIFFWTGPLVDNVLFEVWLDFIFWMCKDECKGVDVGVITACYSK